MDIHVCPCCAKQSKCAKVPVPAGYHYAGIAILISFVHICTIINQASYNLKKQIYIHLEIPVQHMKG